MIRINDIFSSSDRCLCSTRVEEIRGMMNLTMIFYKFG